MADSERCPSCSHKVESAAEQCLKCGFPLAMLRSVVGGSIHNGAMPTLDGSAKRPSITRVAGSRAHLDPGEIVLIGSSAGASRSDVRRLFESHQDIAADHVAVLTNPEGNVWAAWIAADALPLYVDGKPSVAAKLADSSIIQLGPYGWEYHAALRILRPVAPINGRSVPIDAAVPGRLLPTRFVIPAHQMIAITGPSGCGKSTLINEIRLGNAISPGLNLEGEIYFMPQQDLVHDDLRIKDTLTFVAKFYGRDEVLPVDIEDALQSVGLTPEYAERFPSKLSGGQLRRCRIAAALSSGRGVIVLDEPDTGLDHETATEVIRMLRSVSLRGATVIAITHHRHVLELFDRVIGMRPAAEGGRVVSDSCCRAGQEEKEPEFASQDASPNSHDRNATVFVAKPHVRASHQIRILVNRELRAVVSPCVAITVGRIRWPLPLCLISLLLVPLFFAFAIAISVPTDPHYAPRDGLYGEAADIIRLGFLAIVSVVWMSASQSHLALARQRELYDHEQSLGVAWACLLIGKGAVLTVAALAQTLVFLCFLGVFRFFLLERSFFVTEYRHQLPAVWLCLSVVAVAATALGLLVSTCANRSPLTAAAVLPVLMMTQILFSVQFAVSDVRKLNSDEGTGIMDGYRQLAWDTSDSDVDEEKLPLQVTSLLSYFTLTRYGDQWLRSFAASVKPAETAGVWQRRGFAGLMISTIVYYLLAWVLLLLQTGTVWKSIRQWFAGKLAHQQLRPAPALTLLLAACIGLGETPAVSAQTSTHESQATQDPPKEQTWKRISLELVDGRYDANALRRQLGAHAPTEPRWQRLDGKDLLALTALQLAGQIKFDLQGDSLQLHLATTGVSSLVGQLAPCRLDVPANIGDSEQVIVFVHGLEGGASTFSQLRRECIKRGIVPLAFDYPNDGPTQHSALALREQLGELSRQHPGLRLAIVAHSLGGLVAVLAVSDPQFPSGLVTDVFTLGTPFRGSSLAEFQSELELINVVWRLIEKDLSAVDIVSDGRGEAADDIRPGSELLRRLRRYQPPKSIRFHLVAGSKSHLSDEERELLRRELPQELQRLRISLEFAQRIERLLDADELKDGLADGAVTVESATALGEPHCKHVVEATHLELVSSSTSDASKQVFAWILKEMHW